MTNQIHAKNLELTPALEARINKEIDKMNGKLIHDKGTARTVVTLKVDHGKHICEVVVFMPKRKFIKTTSGDDMYQSIRISFSRVTKAIQKHKERMEDKRHDFIKEVSEPVEENDETI